MKSYITNISTDNYLSGVLVLHKSLQRVGARYPLAVLISQGVSDSVELKLKKRGIETIRATQKVKVNHANESNYGSNVEHWNHTFDKLLIFGLEQFEKLVFLDSDLLLLENIDFLFDRPHMTATKADVYIKDWDYLNSSTVVIKPDKKVLKGLLDHLPLMNQKREHFGDQDVIQEYYKDWKLQPDLALPQKYNVFIYFLEDYVQLHNFYLNGEASERRIAIVHFAGKVKPWMWLNRKNIWYYATRMKWVSLRVSLRYLWLVILTKI